MMIFCSRRCLDKRFVRLEYDPVVNFENLLRLSVWIVVLNRFAIEDVCHQTIEIFFCSSSRSRETFGSCLIKFMHDTYSLGS
jgi:hypothetical protein